MHNEKDVAHRDIRSTNFIVSTGMNLILIDFGNAESKRIRSLKEKKGEKNYMAPEIIERKIYDGRRTDIFSLGVLLFHMVIGRLPFETA